MLVCDIGGGTTDLSLFRLALDSDAPGEDAEWPDIERLAVSDHLLLGGDNIDLAIAHLIEGRALGHAIRGNAERRLSRRQWQHLVPQSMRLKERILSGEGPPEEVFHVSIPGEGGGLFASVLNVTLTRADLSAVILDGFFPVTEASERPRTRQMGLREIGLPYAVDTAVSRHLAGFLDGQAVDAVLFAGGTLIPHFLQERLLTLIERWQGRRPIGLCPPRSQPRDRGGRRPLRGARGRVAAPHPGRVRAQRLPGAAPRAPRGRDRARLHPAARLRGGPLVHPRVADLRPLAQPAGALHRLQLDAPARGPSGGDRAPRRGGIQSLAPTAYDAHARRGRLRPAQGRGALGGREPRGRADAPRCLADDAGQRAARSPLATRFQPAGRGGVAGPLLVNC